MITANRPVPRSCVRVVARAGGYGGRGRGSFERGPPRTGTSSSGPATKIFQGLDLKSAAQQVSLDELRRIGRPQQPGRAGRPIQLLTNLFKLQTKTESEGVQTWFQYSVQVTSGKNQAAAPATGGDAEDAKGKKSPAKRPPRGPVKASREDAERVVRALAERGQWQDRYVYDSGSTLVALSDMLPETSEVEVLDDPAEPKGPRRTYQVVLKRVAALQPRQAAMEYLKGKDKGQWPVVQIALDLIARTKAAEDPDRVRAGSSGYATYKAEAPPEDGYSRGPVMPAWLKSLGGFRSSVRLVQTGVMMSVDHQEIAVYQDGPLLDMLQKMTDSRTVPGLVTALRSPRSEVDIKGLEVKLKHTGFKVKLQKVSDDDASLKFSLEEGGSKRMVTVAQYYKEKYNITLKYPQLPLVMKGKVAFPIELCTVVRAQRCAQLKNARQQANLIRAIASRAVLRPEDRLRRIKDIMSAVLGRLKTKVATSFGVDLVSVEPVQITGRMIPGPDLSYSETNPSVTVATRNGGQWNPPPRSPVRKSGTWYSGAILVLLPQSQQNQQGVQQMWSVLQTRLSYAGCQVPDKLPVVWRPVNTGSDVKVAMEDAVQSARARYPKTNKPELMMVIMPDKAGSDVYNEVKRMGDGELGCATQCINPEKAKITRPPRDDKERQRLEMYCDNVVLKINTKLGGHTNAIAGDPRQWLPGLEGRSFMAVGVDVSGNPFSNVDPKWALSFAAVVGTHDQSGVVATAPQLIAQISENKDLVYGMEEAMAGQLAAYAAQNVGNLPEVLLVFRDAVSESMFDELLAVEFTAIKRACRRVQGAPAGYNPKVLFVVVSKTHGLRFFPLQGEGDRSGNVLPGSVVDSQVCDPQSFEFYLNSHAGILGTNRVPRYTVLIDEVGLSPDSVQIMTHWACHTYALCHRSISIPPVARYADKAAARAGQVAGPVAQQLLAKTLQTDQAQYVILKPKGLQGNQSMAYV